MIGIPADCVTTILNFAVNMFTDVASLVWLAIGLPLGFWIARKIIGLVRAG
jgi:hypothetical protein